MKTLKDLFVAELQDTYDAEKQIIEALPKMEKAASAQELKSAFRAHQKQTEVQLTRLGEVFKIVGEPVKGKKCKGMQGLISEGEAGIKEGGDSDVMDVFLIAAAQRVEHYEIAAYGTLRTLAGRLGLQDAKRLLQETLDEEGQTDHLLSRLAEGDNKRAGINENAMAARN